MIIRRIEKEEIEQYDLNARQYGTIFDSVEWVSLFDETVQLYGFFDDNGILQGGFHLNRLKKYGLFIYQNLPFTPDVGPFLKIEAQNPVSVMNLWKRVISLMADFIESLPYTIVTFSLKTDIIDMQPFIWKKYKVVPGYTYLLDLNLSLDEIRSRMSSERRKNINCGEKIGLSVRKITDMKLVKALVMKTYSRQKKTIEESYLDRILFEYSSDKNSFAFSTFRNEEPIACSFCLYDRKAAYYILGGYDSEGKHHGAGALSMWESIRYAKNLGLRHFDFEGSMIPQIEKYFRGFGGQLTPYFRINKAKLPIEILLKFHKREFF